MTHLDGDRGDIVLGWLTKLVAVLAVLGVLVFDAVSVGAGHFQTEDHAQKAARAAVESYRATPDLQLAYQAATGAVLADGDTIDPQTFVAGTDGSITLELRRTVPTLVLDRIRPLRDWTTMNRTVTGRPGPV